MKGAVLFLVAALICVEQGGCLQANQCMRLSDCPTGDVCSAGACVAAAPVVDGATDAGQDVASALDDSPTAIPSVDGTPADGAALGGEGGDVVVQTAEAGD